MTEPLSFDAFTPPEIAKRVEAVGVRKAATDWLSVFVLAVLAGAFIALGAIFATTVATGSSELPYGVSRLLMGLSFCLGLVLVVGAGAELFTGNNMLAMAWASRKITTRDVLRNWAIVYAGNFVGSLGTAVLVFFTQQHTASGGAVGITMLSIANGKVQLDFVQAIALGILCNGLVCLAVWLTFGARSTVDKIAAILFPISAFVAAGFEHSVANMYFVPIGLLVKDFDAAFAAGAGLDLDGLTWGSFLLNNLLPVTIGNIIGGTIMVAAIYWFIYLRKAQDRA
ncbi:MAG: formate/nitrite transporter family protein [Phototrophicaceae bacterium]